MSAQIDDGGNPGRMCLSAFDYLQANMPPEPRIPPMHPPQTHGAGRHASKYQSPQWDDTNTPSSGLREMSFAQYCVAISAGEDDVKRQNVSSAFSDFSVEAAVPVKPKRKVYRVPSYGVLARFLPKFDRGPKKAVDEKRSGDERRSKRSRLRRFLKKCRRRVGMKQEAPVDGRMIEDAKKKDSVIEPVQGFYLPAADCAPMA